MLYIRKKQMMLSLLVVYPVYLYFVACIAPFVKSNLPETIKNLTDNEIKYIPTDFSAHTGRVLLISSFVYFMLMFIIISCMRNTRNGEEYGSAKFNSAFMLARKYRDRIKEANIRLTQNVSIALNTISHRKNLNILIIGGSGTGKSRGFIIPNILLANKSFIVTDPKGEILAKTGSYLKKKGFIIRVLDLKNPEKSFGYNPFKYFKEDNDIIIFVNNLWEAMSDKSAQKGDEVWPELAKAMLLSFMLYLYHFAPPEEQNFDMVMSMYKEVKVSEGMKDEKTVINMLFEEIDHNDTAYGYYKTWSNAKGRTLASILATFAAKMTVFNLETMKNLTFYDEMDLLDFANKDKKIALFSITPDDDKSFNFIAATLYRQLMTLLYDYADNVLHGPLPNLVMFFLDEFANIALPDNFNQIMATARSRNMAFSIVLQNNEQIETLYEKWHKTIISNCDSYIFLGSSEFETCEYFSKLLGKETVSYFTAEPNQKGFLPERRETKVGRELMMPDELRKFSNEKTILFIRGEDPVIDWKINLKKCKNYKELADGKRFKKNLYDWGKVYKSDGEASVIDGYTGIVTPLPKTNARLLDNNDIKLILR